MAHQLTFPSLQSWLPTAGNPLIISGPCSAESEEQMVNTALQLAATGKVHMLRAGIWKPRTRPGQFEGAGLAGLDWLMKAREATKLPVCTEVATAAHVEACLKAGVDVLWVGARTTVNPFSVQDIADALQGVDIPVLVKNPVNPDLELWIGALERLHRAGITKMAAIHRGFSSHQKGPLRNAPMWEIAQKLKAQLPDLPMLCDPSHIAGQRDLIAFISQKAMDLQMDGLIIESHICPDRALSDANQQITPAVLGAMIGELISRDTSVSAANNSLQQMREQIDQLDDEILQKLAARFLVCEKIGQFKQQNELDVMQMSRWEKVRENRLAIAAAMGLSKEFTDSMLKLVHQESVQVQNWIKAKEQLAV
ncbi:MAG: bifunctional 3-deoxy-7-phosphoheptulonate synthase/chorismate mutase type II [Bacteroidetes bacterium]|nr:bifunctional 3-deoxy-7-phosphoheptulonate synthase/chorismate mutase type II [Bacteroidota bacterium]